MIPSIWHTGKDKTMGIENRSVFSGKWGSDWIEGSMKRFCVVMDCYGDYPNAYVYQNSELCTKKGNFTKLKKKQTIGAYNRNELQKHSICKRSKT